MKLPEPSLSLGIEEEYLLVEKSSRDLVRQAPDGLMTACEKSLESQVSPEFLQCQIEVGTQVCKTVQEAHADLAHLRQTIAQHAATFDLAPIAASTHPFAEWSSQQFTDKQRYTELAREMQTVGRRMLISGMHIHIGIEDEDLRIDLFNQLSYFLPHLLALSASSPFWQGRDTGLQSYRLTIFDNLPRTGLPPNFDSFGEYQRTTDMLIGAGIIEDASKIWWDLRPSSRFPTIEARICDVPTRLSDTITIAALMQCIVRMLYRLRCSNQRWRRYDRFFINENRWRAQRYGTQNGLIDFGRREVVPYGELLDELIDLIEMDARDLGCLDEIHAARDIVARGTSAQRQRRAYDNALAQTKSSKKALMAVTDHLIEETVTGL